MIKPGYADYSSKVLITKAKTTVLNATLTQYGVLDISSVPSGAYNWVDWVNSTKFTNANVDVISGNRLIQLMNNGYRSYSFHVPISSGKTTSVNVTLAEINRQDRHPLRSYNLFLIFDIVPCIFVKRILI